MSLATLSFRKIGEDVVKRAGISLHDLHFEFCQQQAKLKNMEALWHEALLHGYLTSSSDPLCCDPCGISSAGLLELLPRPWWSDSILDDGYIHAHLARHLSFCGRGSELTGVLLDARWMHVRGKLGGLLGLKADFDILDKLFQTGGIPEKSMSLKDIRGSFQVILKAAQLSWGRFLNGQRAFQFQMYGRLLCMRSKDVIVDAVMNSLEAHTPKPFLKPVSSFFPDLNSAQIYEIPVGGWCGCVAFSPCGSYIAAGSRHDIVLVDLNTGEVLKRLHGHEKPVSAISFIGGPKRIVSASDDRTVAVWEWEKSDSPSLVLKGHSGEVHSVAVSHDGERIFSGSRDGTLRVWNAKNGLQIAEFCVDEGGVDTIAITADDRKMAIGLLNGTMKVIDCCTGETLFGDSTIWVPSFAFSSDGRRLVTVEAYKTVHLWDAETWTEIASPSTGHDHEIISFAFSPNGQHLASTSKDGTVRTWDIAPAITAGNYSCGPFLTERAVFSTDQAGILPQTIYGHILSWFESVIFSADGTRGVSGSSSGFVRVWDALFEPKEEQRGLGHDDWVNCVSISPDGLRVASGSSDKKDTTVECGIGCSNWGTSGRPCEQCGNCFVLSQRTVVGVRFGGQNSQAVGP